MCAWQVPNLHESPWSCWDGAGRYCGAHPQKLGPENQNLPIWAGLLGPFRSLRLLSEGSEASAPQTPPTSTILPSCQGLASAQWLQTRLEGGSSGAKALSCQGPSGAARPQAAKLPHAGHAHRGTGHGSGCGSSACRTQTQPLSEKIKGVKGQRDE